MKKAEIITGRLEGWSRDKKYKIIWGFVYDDIHKRFRDGTWIHTSKIVTLTKTKVKTLNSIYKLGTPFNKLGDPFKDKDDG